MMHPYVTRIAAEMAEAQQYRPGQAERIICERTAWRLQQIVDGIAPNDQTSEPPAWFLAQFRSAA